ncbi:tetratricopeptide repeat protein [Campylobacter canadensis]|uniref:beta-lactamase n=1 Tax=Campylobacter canadensis TaxID=449520 RepID=A0ABS7WSH7_9BACT|nr:tetratricopeptide repeat protein [Campylobacter canadensis]MBZ7986930.1 sel1 repeat family protein [Campylobacter canadensis]MBZ7994251.1 sel1 repeat family protein [Campylobacter canadensis]MBZ7995757.1 sel1 repeat family protein [Campylobacter canadensis]MBZ7997966.1 sel1 repeat family protein [Campylobacter canadensis]MBZ7999583.1 sel1 repeat family protein [Campylobacter canadensis]
MKKILLMSILLTFTFANVELFNSAKYDKAYKEFKKTCLKNDALSCYYLGKMNEDGLGTKASYEYAFKYYKQACDLNNNDACAALGNLYYLGLGTNKDIKKAEKLLKDSCDKNSDSACLNYAWLYKNEYNEIKSDELIKACNNNYAAACNDLALYTNNIQSIDFSAHSCALANEVGCANLLEVKNYIDKLNTFMNNFNKQSIEECNLNNIKACKAAGMLGLGDEYLKKACDLNDAEACIMLANNLQAKNELDLVFEYSKKACDLNDAYSCSKLAYLYKNGLSADKEYVKQDSKKAQSYFKRACFLGFKKACEL